MRLHTLRKAAASGLLLLPVIAFGQTILFTEDFENTNLAARGWYDNTAAQTFSTVEHTPGSTQSLEYHWLAGTDQPTSGGALRRKFTPTTTLYVSYWVKYSSNYVGSGKTYHPHEIYVLTNKDSDFSGLAFTTLTFYIQQVVGSKGVGVPQLEIQDGKMVDKANIGVNLIGVTENRAVAGCNGVGNTGGVTLENVFGGSDCYAVGADHWNSYEWNSPTVRLSLNTWQHVEVYAQLNSVAGGIGQNDGVIKYWLDGTLIIDQSSVIFRTGANADMVFNQFVMGPYIGDLSPIDQKFWIDDLTVATARPAVVSPPAPQKLRAQ